jgi:protein ImuA
MFIEHSQNKQFVAAMPTPSLASPSLNRLRSRIAALEGTGREVVASVVPLGTWEVDAALPWGGLPLGCLHEVAPLASPDGIEDGAALGFAALLLGRLAATRGRPVLWMAARDDLYPPGLAGLGLAPERLLMVRPGPAAQGLWALEEAVRCTGLSGVLGEVRGIDFTAARRLQLAARASGVAALLLNRGQPCGPAVTRWRVGPAPGEGPPAEGVWPWRWRLELTHCRGRGTGEEGVVSAWTVEWCDETRGFRVAAPADDRSADEGPARRTG